MLQLFRPMHFAQLANYLIRAQRRRFAVGGMDLMVAQAAEPPALAGQPLAVVVIARIAGRVMMMMLGAMVPRPGYWRVCSGCAASDTRILFPV